MIIKVKNILREEIYKLICEDANLKNRIFVAYGTDKYDENKFKNADIENTFTLINNKPFGGLWASPLDSKWGWGHFCSSEEFRLNTLGKHFLFKLKPNAKIYVIDNQEDYKKIAGLYNHINYRKLMINHYDGIFMTLNGLNAASKIDSSAVSAWDVESLCVFNKNIIIPIDENAFDKAKVNMFEKDLDYNDEMNYYFSNNSNNDRKNLQMKSDYDKYSNQNVNSDMSKLFNGEHPAILAQKHGNAKNAKLARKFNGTIKSGLD